MVIPNYSRKEEYVVSLALAQHLTIGLLHLGWIKQVY
jgi:hypothetical protein